MTARESAEAGGSDGSGADPSLDDLLRDTSFLERSSTAERVAERLRELIMAGRFQPGSQLGDAALAKTMRISRNTLREAFRLLAHERLLVHELNRGVFVRRLDAADVVDLFAVRRVIECAAVRLVDSHTPEAVARLDAVVADAERAAADGRWADLGTGNMLFHQAIAGLLGSRRVNELMRQLLAELRLVFLVMADTSAFHQTYLPRNRAILTTLAAGDVSTAEAMLHQYLLDAEREILATHET